jgi:RNA-splicing ligase RtcB
MRVPGVVYAARALIPAAERCMPQVADVAELPGIEVS